MFNLEKAIENWKQELRSNPAFEDGDIEELGSHLRDRIQQLKAEEFNEKEAFEKASEEMGEPESIGTELYKTKTTKSGASPSWKQSSFTPTLMPNYIKTSVRNFRKRVGYSLINILGLTVGLATCLFILFFVTDELSYDKFHEDLDRIYRVINSTNDDGTPTNANGSFAAGPLLKQDYPDQVKEYGRLRSTVYNSKMYMSYGNNKYYEDRFYFADPGFLRMFNFPLVKGNPENVLQRPNTLLLTEKMAKKYFGNENPIGKTITADPYQNGELLDFEVTGVMENLPSNTHFNFEFLASYQSQLEEGLDTNLGGFEGNYTYLKLAVSASPSQLESKFSDFQSKNWTDDPWYTMSLQPVESIHLHSHLKSEIEANGNILYVYVFSAVAVLILIIAGINFVNLATARSTERAKEVGLRKAIGAQKGQLMSQFIGESITMTMLAGVLAALLAFIMLPQFNSLTQKQLEFSQFLIPEYAAGYVGFLILIGLLAGLYPAFVLSSFETIEVFKTGGTGAAGGVFLRKILVVAQFTISAALIASTVIVYQQINFIKNTPLGYARDQVLTIPLNPEARDNYEAIRSELMQHSGIQSVSSSSHVPTSGTSHNVYKISGIEDELSFAAFYVDKNFLETYDLTLQAGSNISEGISLEDSVGHFMVSSLAVEEAGLETPEDMIGRTVEWDVFSGPVTGVVNDMVLYDLRQLPYSLIFVITPVQFHKYISVKINTAQTSEVLAHLNKVWDEQVASYPLEYNFLDEKFEQMHLSDQKMAETIIYFAILAIVIACLGLFGLTAYMVQRKTKEIGVRKVLGATIPQVIILLSRDFMKLVAIALVLGLPIAYWGMHTWLQEFAFKIEIQPSVFIYCCLIVLMISFLTISYQAFKAARLNPAVSLKNE